ncbi:hypothetical protein BZG36_03288 [Bifiguratus adelaidae]|uniref:Uncharacterized protein n=1 Tax=Bifiguratus adelaidae TaxID=1938954 RepID=A0A261XZW2_9FUNG|nr:hypothetical protein BZG36_03288 [Bifiguratus adelaidae]
MAQDTPFTTYNESQPYASQTYYFQVTLLGKRSLMLWVGEGDEAILGELAMALPSKGNMPPATTLLGSSAEIAQNLAKRMAYRYAKQFYVSINLSASDKQQVDPYLIHFIEKTLSNLVARIERRLPQSLVPLQRTDGPWNFIQHPLPVLEVTCLVLAVAASLGYAFAAGLKCPDQRVFPALLTTVAGIMFVHFMTVLFGAAFFKGSYGTMLFASHLAILTILPLAVYWDLDVDRWLNVLVLWQCADTLDVALLLQTWMHVLGAWLGAVVIPLDWDRAWQVWPIPCVLGTSFGNLLVTILLLACWIAKIDLMSLVSTSQKVKSDVWQGWQDHLATLGYESTALELKHNYNPPSTGEEWIQGRVHELAQWMRKDMAFFPPILIAHGLEAITACKYVESNPVSALVLLSPFTTEGLRSQFLARYKCNQWEHDTHKDFATQFSHALTSRKELPSLQDVSAATVPLSIYKDIQPTTFEPFFPILMCTSHGDKFVPPDDIERYHALAGQVDEETVKSVGHLDIFEHAEQQDMLHKVVQWLDECGF